MISIQELLGQGYGDFYHFKGRYRVVVGSRASKKSKDTALDLALKLTKYPKSNLLVVRKTFRSLENSCFTDLKWAFNRLGLDHEWNFKTNPLEATNKRTKQKIYFRGLDDALKITSISVETGYLNFVWLEEAFEVTKESDFDMVDESIRGAVPEDYYKQITITLNPWNERHWIKRRFFDEIVDYDTLGNPIYKETELKEVSKGSYSAQKDDVLIKRTTYLCNEWLDDADLKLFELMKSHNPRRYQTAGLGKWGVVDGLIYENFTEYEFSLKDVAEYKMFSGLDFGFTNDPTAFIVGFIDKESKVIYIWDELYKKGLTNNDIRNEIVDMGYQKLKIVADSAEPKSIEELKALGLKVFPAKKGKDSIKAGIQYIQNFRILIHPRCVNFITEINNYSWAKDRFGKPTNEPVDDFNHLQDALRYAVLNQMPKNSWQFSYRKLL